MIENFEINITEKVAKLETKVIDIEKQVDNMDDMSTAITRLVTLQEKSDEDKKIFYEEMKSQSKLLTGFELTLVKINDNFDKINDNLNGMNTEIKNTNSKMDDLKKEVYCKMNDFENKVKISSDEKKYIKIDKAKVLEFIKGNYKKILLGLGGLLGLTGVAKANQIIEFIQSLIG